MDEFRLVYQASTPSTRSSRPVRFQADSSTSVSVLARVTSARLKGVQGVHMVQGVQRWGDSGFPLLFG